MTKRAAPFRMTGWRLGLTILAAYALILQLALALPAATAAAALAPGGTPLCLTVHEGGAPQHAPGSPECVAACLAHCLAAPLALFPAGVAGPVPARMVGTTLVATATDRTHPRRPTGTNARGPPLL